MRRIKITIGLAVVAICAVGVLAAPAFAKEKMVFGEFQGDVVGKNLETEPATVLQFHEDEGEVSGMQLGPYKFGTKNAKGEIQEGNPCEGAPKIGGVFKAEEGKGDKSNSMLLHIKFKKCVSWAGANGISQKKKVSFELGVRFAPNFSSEVGQINEAGLELEESVVEFKGALNKCPVVIPRQTIPVKINPEKEYEEIVEYFNETEPVENWEKSKKLKEIYPSGKKDRIEIELGEKFHSIRTFVKATGNCVPAKGEDNPKLIEEGPEGPYGGIYNGWLEYSSGKIFADFEDVEIKNGELKFVPPA